MSINSSIVQRADLIGPLLNLQGIPAEMPHEVILDSIEIVARQALAGLKAFHSGNLHLLDPSIGDECCQLRALMTLKLTAEGGVALLEQDCHVLNSLIESIIEVRKKITMLDQGYEAAKAEADLAKEGIRQKKVTLNQAKNQDLVPHEKGSDGAAKVMQEFKLAMSKLSEEEKPILQGIKQKLEVLKAKKLQLIGSLAASLSLNGRLIAVSYILTKIKECTLDKSCEVHVLHDKMNLRGIQINGLSFNGAVLGPVIDRAKTVLNHESVIMIREEAGKLTSKRAPLLIKALQHTMPSAKSGFNEVSFYHGCEVVMKRVKALGIPILVKARGPKDVSSGGCIFPHAQLYIVDKLSGKYVPAKEPVADVPVLVIEGISKKASKNSLESIIAEAGGVMKAVRYNLSQHRFCTAEEVAIPTTLLQAEAISESEYLKIEQERTIACMNGFSAVNYNAFRIEHMYAATLNG